MSVFKEEADTKRVIFNVRMDLAQRLDRAKKDARDLGKKLDVDGAVDKALEKFLKKAEKKIAEAHKKRRGEDDEAPKSASVSRGEEPEADEAADEEESAEASLESEDRSA